MKKIIASLSILAIWGVFAEDVSFPLDSGDISNEENWNGEFPSSECTVKLDENGPYSISKDLSVLGLIAHSSSPSITVSDGVKISIMNALRKDGLEFRANTVSGASLTGGFFHMVNGANCEMLFGRYEGSTTPGATASLSSVTISNACYFTAVRHFSDAVLTVGERSRIYSQYGKISHSGASSWCRGNTMNLVSGSEWHVSSILYFESEANENEDGLGGGSTLCVTGRDSLVSVDGGVVLGDVGCSNKLHVADCARLESSKIEVGGQDSSNSSKGYGGNTVLFSNSATGRLNTVFLGMRPGGGGNVFAVASNSHVTVHTMTVGNQDPGNVLVVDNAVLDVTSQLHVGSGKNAAGTDNTVILRGRNPQIFNRNSSSQWVYAYNRSKFRFEVPEEGFADIPIKGSHFGWNGDVVLEVECKKFRKAGGGDIVLAEAGADTWVDQNTDGNLAKCIVELNKKQPKGCSFEIKGKQIIYHASYLPPVGMRLVVR